MSTKRKGKWGGHGKGPNGRPLCACGCGEELPANAHKNSTSIAGHYQKWAAIHNPATVRRLVYERDQGICAGCGVDTEKRAQESRETHRLLLWLARRHAEDLLAQGKLPMFSQDTPAGQRYLAARVAAGERVSGGDAYHWANHWANEDTRARFGETTGAGGHTWEADHIVPVVEGGGECGLENYRTLCLTCHRKETAALAARRAARRRAEKTAGAPIQLELA